MPGLTRVAVMLELEWPYPWHHNIFAGVQEYADTQGDWTIIIDEYAAETIHASGPGSPPYDGVIARATGPLARVAKRAGIPVVNVWTDSPARHLPGVFADLETVGRLAARHLLDRGLRQFGCLSVPQHVGTGLATRGFHEVLSGAGCECRCCHVHQNYSRTPRDWRETTLAIDRWIDDWQPPVGVFVTLADTTSRQVANRCLERGLRIPDDVGLVKAVDDDARITTQAPALTGVAMPFMEVGRRASALLGQLMKGRTAPPTPILVPPQGVMQRTSTARAEDELVARAEQFMLESAHREIDVRDIAAAAGTLRRTLERRFRRLRGQSLADALRTIRIERAKRLLVDTDLAVKQIALECGFGRSVRLSEVFRREVGYSPTEYRVKERPTPARAR